MNTLIYSDYPQFADNVLRPPLVACVENRSKKGYVELKSKSSQNEVIKARGQIVASHHHMLAIVQSCAFSLSDFVQKGIIITQPVTDETLTKACQRRKRDDNLKVTLSSARFLLKLIEGEAKDEATGICFVHATATGALHLKEIL